MTKNLGTGALLVNECFGQDVLPCSLLTVANIKDSVGLPWGGEGWPKGAEAMH